MIRNSNGSATIKWEKPYGFIEENVCFYIVEIDGKRKTTEKTEYMLLTETHNKDIIVSVQLIYYSHRFEGLKNRKEWDELCRYLAQLCKCWNGLLSFTKKWQISTFSFTFFFFCSSRLLFLARTD